VSPRTFLRWVHDEQKPPTSRPRGTGRPRTEEAIYALVIRFAAENGWGYTRILGELKKLGVRRIARSTVKRILKEHGFDTGPGRGHGTWTDFVERHASTLFACDFFSTKVWTMRGLVDVFVLFVIHVGTRRVQVTGITTNPDRPWMIQQARNFALHFAVQPAKPRNLVRNLDTKFVSEFDQIINDEGVEVAKVGPRKPNLNPFAERFVQSVRRECLDHFMVFGEAHLRYILKSWSDHYHEERPHQGIDNCTPRGPDPPVTSDIDADNVECRERLGGLLKSYHRRAA